ncbi:MAG: DNA polymerase III subunit beta [Actinobacteria bacterium]|nr:DNA polymerase III subunit beta [Actinomycetota bacterium]
MNIQISQEELNRAVQTVQKAVSPRALLPVLSGVHFKAANGMLHLYATDLELSIKCVLPATVREEGETVIPARLLGEIVKNLPAGNIEIVSDDKGGNIKIISLNAVFDIRSYSPSDFPKFPNITGHSGVKISGRVLSDVIKHVIKAVSRDETRPILSGVLINIDKGHLKMVATDSYRLSIKDVAVEGLDATQSSAVIPGRCLDEVSKAVGDKDVEIILEPNLVYFDLGDTVIISRLIEGQFPNYQQLLPSDCDLRVKFSRQDLIAGVRRVALLAQSTSLVKMKIDNNEVEISAISQDLGSAIERVSAKTFGEGIEIAFNANYLLDGLQSIGEDEINIELNSPLKPGLVRPVQDRGFIYLIMPVRIG